MDNLNATHSGNPLNAVDPKPVSTRSKFDLPYMLNMTARFGDITPHFVMNVVPGDKDVTERCSHEINSYTLKAPLLQNIRINKAYSFVPLQAILPFNADKIVVSPKVGDDVPVDANTVCTDFTVRLLNLVFRIYNKFESLSVSVGNSALLSVFFNNLNLFSYFYSAGSLLNYLGKSVHPLYRFRSTRSIVSSVPVDSSYDVCFDLFCNYFVNVIQSFSCIINGEEYFVKVRSNSVNDLSSDYKVLSFRSFLGKLHDNGYVEVLDVTTSSTDLSAMLNFFLAIISPANVTSLTDGDNSGDAFNFSRLAAYQLTCAEFFTNDNVDYLYSADLYRQNLLQVCRVLTNETISEYFTYNGVLTNYDAFSGNFMKIALDYSDSFVDGNAPYFYGYFSLVFAYRRSLRYMDYFTGAKVAPLAVGDVNVSVGTNGVNVVDITRNIQRQRFLNSVNKAGRKLKEYVQDMFGASPSYDYHNPMFIGSTEEMVGSEITENTGSAQRSNDNRTSLLHANSSNFAFSFDSDLYGVLLGVTYFDVLRLYTRSTDRDFFHTDRYDMFVKQMQFIGDQPILGNEITAYNRESASAPLNFGYTTRYMEFKQRVSRAVGGFVENLPAWCFLADNVSGIPLPRNINPDYIRSSWIELDEFYTSLTGYSLGSYFHFIMKVFNDCSASRPMAYNPTIL